MADEIEQNIFNILCQNQDKIGVIFTSVEN
jgi:hypothetical protein